MNISREKALEHIARHLLGMAIPVRCDPGKLEHAVLEIGQMGVTLPALSLRGLG